MAYTYYIFHKPTNQHYYGARWAANSHPDDFWKTYFTSSKKVKILIEHYGLDSFSVQIRKVFSNEHDARLWEHRVLKKINACSRTDWLNTSNGQPPICNYSRKGQGLGRALSEEHKLAISNGNKGKKKPQTDDHKAAAAAARKGTKRSSDTRMKMSISSRAAKPIYTFIKGEVTFIGNLSDWADQFNINVQSAATTFCKGRIYKGWERISFRRSHNDNQCPSNSGDRR